LAENFLIFLTGSPEVEEDPDLWNFIRIPWLIVMDL
jgi:hypothetical protein